MCLLLGSTNRANSHSTQNHRRSAHNHKIIEENVSSPPPISDQNAQQVHEGKPGKGNQTLSGRTKNSGTQCSCPGTGNRTPSGSGGQPHGQKNTNGAPGGGNRNPGQTPQSGGNKGNAQGSQGKGQGKIVWGLSFRQGQGAWRRWRSLIRRPWPWKGQSSCGSGVRCRSGDRCRQGLHQNCLESSR